MNAASARKKPATAVWVFACLFLLVGGLTWWKWQKAAQKNGPPGGPGRNGPVTVTAFCLSPAEMPVTLECPGNLLPWREVNLAAEVPGRITEINLQEGKAVREGDLLLAVNDEDLLAEKARLMAQKELALRTRARNAELLAVQGVSRQEADQAETQVQILEAELRSAEAGLNKTRIRAPFSGILGFSDLQKGAYINAGMPLTRLQDVETLKLEFSVPARYAAEIRPGMQVRFSVESEPDTFEATVFAIDPGVDAASRTLRIRARFPNSRGLRAGSFARTEVVLNRNKNSLAVPTQSVIPDTRGKKVVRVRNGQPEFSFIETGVRQRDYIQVLKGLEPGDTVLTTGLMFVRPGTPIRITKTEYLRP